MDLLNDLRIQYNFQDYLNGKVYITVGLGVGTSARYFKCGDEQIDANLAFANVWAEYMRIDHYSNYIFEVGRTNSIVRCTVDATDYAAKIAETLELIFTNHLEKEKFQIAKDNCKNSLTRAYKKSSVRGRLKCYEFADSCKGFSLGRMIHNIEDIRFEEFESLYQKLIVPANSILFVNGALIDMSDEEKQAIENAIPKGLTEPEALGLNIDPILREDVHLVTKAREKLFMDTLHLTFDSKADMNLRYIYTMIEMCKIQGEEFSVEVNPFETSLIFKYPKIASNKKAFKNPSTEEIFERGRNNLIAIWKDFLEKKPEGFGREVATLYLNGIDYIVVLNLLSHINYEQYLKLHNDMKPIVSEAQLIMEK